MQAHAGMFLALPWILLSVPEASAQIVFGTILCTVQDQDGAVIPKAGVSARNLETVAVLAVVTGTSGADRINSNSTPKLVPNAGQPKSPTVTTSRQVQFRMKFVW